MVTFKLSDFEKKLLKVEPNSNPTTFTTDTKFVLGIRYAMAVDPGFKFPKEMTETNNFYFVDDNNEIIKSNDNTIFNNPNMYPDNVKCEVAYIARKQNCCVVYFTFIAAHPFIVPYPYTSIVRTVLGKNHLLCTPYQQNILSIEYSQSDVEYPEDAISEYWVITNDVFELSAIPVSVNTDDSDNEDDDDDESDDESDDDSDTEDDANTDDESDDDSE